MKKLLLITATVLSTHCLYAQIPCKIYSANAGENSTYIYGDYYNPGMAGHALVPWGKNDVGQLNIWGNASTNTNKPTNGCYSGMRNSSWVFGKSFVFHRIIDTAYFSNVFYDDYDFWGDNSFGQFGSNTTTGSGFSTFQLCAAHPTSLVDSIVRIALGYNHCVEITRNNKLLVWGHNASGELGDSTNIDKLQPISITNSNDWANVFAKGEFRWLPKPMVYYMLGAKIPMGNWAIVQILTKTIQYLPNFIAMG